MAAYSKKLLVLVDGSERSLQAVRYVGHCLPPSGLKVVLFNAFDPVPECYWDLENQPRHLDAIRQLKSWEVEKKKKIENFMEDARSILLDLGFEEASVEIKIKNRRSGIARDIVTEAQTGYDAVALARHGVGALESLIMGSVASKLLSTLSSVPLIIVGNSPLTKKILLAVDGSSAAERMVEFVGAYLTGSSHDVMLFHVIRGFNVLIPEHPELMIPVGRFDLARTEMEAFFTMIKEKLVLAGLDLEKISEKIVSGEFSRAGAILREASEGGFAAIAVGRRGISKVEAFLMGRVSNKVIHGGRNHTVWVI